MYVKSFTGTGTQPDVSGFQFAGLQDYSGPGLYSGCGKTVAYCAQQCWSFKGSQACLAFTMSFHNRGSDGYSYCCYLSGAGSLRNFGSGDFGVTYTLDSES